MQYQLYQHTHRPNDLDFTIRIDLDVLVERLSRT